MTRTGPARTAATLHGAVEAGGTKFICAIGTRRHEIVAEARFDTSNPEITLARVARFFEHEASRHERIATVGVGSFGPLQLNPELPRFGHIMRTPKAGWRDFDIRGALEQKLGVPVCIDTDVNCALRAEAAYGAGRGYGNLAYLTIGTGIGGSFMLNGEVLGGQMHPEIGHILLPKDASDGHFAGICPYHADRCAEGLASGPALKARIGTELESLADGHPVWDLASSYLGILCGNLTLTFSPQRIILGGGVMSRKTLIPRIEAEMVRAFGDYVPLPTTNGNDGYIVATGLGGRAGVLGALMLATAGG